MIKKRLKYILIIAIMFSSVSTINVYAKSNATGGVTNNGSEDCSITYTGKDGNGNDVSNKCHKTYDITVKYNGTEYTGYCGDINKQLAGYYNDPTSYTCEEVADASINYILNSTASYAEKTAALRSYTTGISVSGSNGGVVNSLVSSATGAVASGPLTFMKSGGSGSTVIYSVTSPVALSNVTFTCGSGCTVNSSSWSGTSGTVAVTATNGACSFTINATYPGVGTVQTGASRVLECSAQGVQKIYITVNDTVNPGGSTSAENGQVTQSFTGTIDKSTGGSYYEEYCSNENDNACVCSQTTTVNMPGLCDIGDNSASIDAPTDVKCCILNNKDEAGNTYQMSDGQISSDNPYCAVYCKEDYKMTLPGAQYTDSGRYFTLNNTIVEAKRTCYATNPNHDAKNPQILIDEFVTDVKEQQKAVMDAFNAYQTAKAKYESVKDLPEEQATTTCPEFDTFNNIIGTIEFTYMKAQSGASQPKEVANSSVKNADEGSYLVKTSQSSDRDSIGENFSCKNGTSLAGTFRTKAEYQSDMNAKRAVLNEAREQLKKTIEHMEECYSWINDLCMDPTVIFDYEEQYNSDINYVRVDGNGTSFPSSNATYSDQKTINNEYSANDGGSLETINYAFCDEKTCNNEFSEGIANDISTLVNHLYYRKIEANGYAEYANVQEFQTNYPHGTIDTTSGGTRPNYSYLGTVFPVALKTPTGVYKWTLNFSNLGQYNDYAGCKNGRLDDVVRAIGASTSASLEYVCVYVVDCDDCDYECVGEGCLITDEPKCPECDVYCINCIFDGDEDTYFYRTTSVNDFNPNNRKLGANWTNEKGQTTRNEIESIGENVYIDAEYTYVLDAGNMKAIRDYNKETDTYVAQDLTYHDQNGIANAYGTSSFLDVGQSKGFFTEKKRNTSWTLWSDGTAWK